MNTPDATIAVVGETATAHATVQEAVDHVCTATGHPRGGVWLRDDLWFRGTWNGLFVFFGPPQVGSQDVPLAWLTDAVSYQAAKSRGDLEDVQDFF